MCSVENPSALHPGLSGSTHADISGVSSKATATKNCKISRSGYNRPLNIQYTYHTASTPKVETSETTSAAPQSKQNSLVSIKPAEGKTESSHRKGKANDSNQKHVNRAPKKPAKSSPKQDNSTPKKETSKPSKSISTESASQKTTSKSSDTQPPKKDQTLPATSNRNQTNAQSLPELIARTTDPVDRAALIRKLEISQLERRFKPHGWTQISSKVVKSAVSSIGTVLDTFAFSMPVTDPDFPYELENNSLKLHLSVPQLYPTAKQTTIYVLNDEIPADLRRGIERGWAKKSENVTGISLLQMCNWLDRQLEELLIRPPEPATKITFVRNINQNTTTNDRVRSIDPTVPELINTINTSSESSDSDSDFDACDADSDSDVESNPDQPKLPESKTTPHRGIQIRLTNMTLSGISLLHCTSLNLMLRCTKCRTTVQATNLTNYSEPRRIPCTSCTAILSIRFRPDFAHRNNQNIGYLDVDQCVPFDLLPSIYAATCGRCDAEHAFKKVVRGVMNNATCLHCYWKLGLRIDEVKFVGLAPTTLSEATDEQQKKMMMKKKKKDELMLVGGQNLPNKGTCKHYKKSYRWLRFPCCGKLFPCDVCHEESNPDNHEMLHATRMICGYCSREQPYSTLKPCVACKSHLTSAAAKSGNPFWEGGKGVRDRAIMSAKDKRKFSGMGKTVSKKAMDKKK